MSSSEMELNSDIVVEVLRNPLQGASLFYALLYLVDVEGWQPAAFDFKQLREKQARAFYWYGVWGAVAEFANVRDRFLIDGFVVSAYLNSREVNINPDPDGETIPETLIPEMLDPAVRELVDDPALEETAIALFRGSDDLVRSTDHEIESPHDVEELFLALDHDVFGTLAWVEDDARHLLRTIEAVFANSDDVYQLLQDHDAAGLLDPGMTDDDFDRRLAEIEHALAGWSNPLFNGQAWTGIVRHLLRRPEFSDTVFVDQSWSIQHNTNIWINKVTPNRRELDVVRAVDGRIEDMDPVGPIEVWQNLELLLDAAQAGDMDVVFDYAVHFNDEVGVNLRRARTLFDV